MLPFENRTDIREAPEQLRQALVAELRHAALFEVVSPAPEMIPLEFSDVHESGRFRADLLVEMARLYNVDAVMFGTLTEYSPFRPIQVGAAIHIVSASESVTLLSLAGNWDSRIATVAEDARLFFGELSVPDVTLSDEFVLQSPSLFMKFVGHQMTHAVDWRRGPHQPVVLAAQPLPIDDPMADLAPLPARSGGPPTLMTPPVVPQLPGPPLPAPPANKEFLGTPPLDERSRQPEESDPALAPAAPETRKNELEQFPVPPERGLVPPPPPAPAGMDSF